MKGIILLTFVGCFFVAMALAEERVMPVEMEIPTHLWTKTVRADAGLFLHFTVALEQRNIQVLHDRLMEISDPTHADYGRWLSKQEVDDLTAPAVGEREEVIAVLRELLDPFTITDNVDHIRVLASVGNIERAFSMEFWMWESVEINEQTGKRNLAVVSPSTYVLPAELPSTVAFLAGLTGFPVPKERRLGMHRPLRITSIAPRDDQEGKVAPSVLVNVYGTPTATTNNPNASLCLAEFQNDHSYAPSDLVIFDQENLLTDARVTHIEGGLNYSPPDLEATLDVQYGSAAAVNASIWYWSNPGWMYEFTVNLNNQEQMPLVVSISWGWTETAQCSITSCLGVTNNQYIAYCDANWLKITSRGTTVVASSGDQGAPGDANPSCLNTKQPLSVMYPSVSPYILSVGATALQEPAIQPPPPPNQTPFCAAIGGCSQSTTEIVCTYPDALITTGGGFSTIESQPAWQKAAVSSYLANAGSGLPPSTLFNSAGRANPDVSALGHNYVIVVDGSYELVDGTSCSAPVWGGIISVLNDALLSQGKPPLGFINPLLYNIHASTPSAFNDITSGNNACTERCCSKYGYPAIPGWDASTGLGTPNYPVLSKAILGN